MTMDCCLICFRLVSASGNMSGEKKNEKLKVFQRFFKLLNRHLKVDEKNFNDDINKTNSIFSNYAVNFGKAPACGECLEVMSSFCEVYHKIKTLELILNQKMKMLMNIMFCAGKVPARVACFKETFSNKLDTSGPSTDQRINKILQYKKLLITKCSEMLSETYPKLKLERIPHPMEEDVQNQVFSEKVMLHSPSFSPDSNIISAAALEELEAPSKEPDTSSQMDTADCFEDFTAPSPPITENASSGLSCKLEANNEEIEIRNNQEDEINDESSIEVENVKPSLQLSSTEPNLPSTSRTMRTIHKCDICGRTFSSSDKLLNHQSSENCEDTLEKQDKVESGSEHEDEVDNLSFKSGNDSSSTSTDCEEEADVKPYLGNQVKSSKVKSGLHLKRQQEPGLSSTDPCPVCQKEIFVTSVSSTALKDLSQHILQEHPEAFKTLGTPQPFSCPVFYCPFTADNVRSLTNHCCQKHKAEFKLRLRYEKEDHLVTDLENPLHCPFANCDAACLNRAVLTIHLKSAHESECNPNNLTNLSRKFFTDRMASMNKAVDESSQHLNEDRDREKEELKSKKLRAKCPKCGGFFSNFYKMILHLKNSHLSSQNEEENMSEKDKLTIETFNLREDTSEELDGEYKIYSKIEINSSKVFSCPERKPPCGQLFLFEGDLEAHRKLHGEFKCQFCEFIEENAVKLAEHELKEHTDRGDSIKETDYRANLHCSRCEEMFYGKYKYLVHFVTKHLSVPRLMEQCCPICRDPHGFPAWTNGVDSGDANNHFFRYHNLLSDPKDVFQCKAKGCFAYFKTLMQLRKHTQIVHSFVTLECMDCGKALKTNYALRLHRLRFHVKNSDKIACTVKGCQEEFELEKDLTVHLKWAHIDQNQSDIKICSKCGKSWNGTASFQKHMAAHARKEKAEADGLMALSFVCESCGEGFKTRSSLDLHILRRHKGPESWKFQCKTCNKKCFDAHKLTEHMRTHSNEKPFICEVCGAAYGHRHNLRIHVNNKHGDVIQDIPRKVDTSNLFRRKRNTSTNEASKKKMKRKRGLQKEDKSDLRLGS